MKVQDRLEAAATALKVFPLPSAVLFPGTALPLHIFEPRYREMVKDALAGDRIIALGDLLPGWERDYAGRPPLAPIACAGAVVFHEELPDGRFNLVLHGLSRVQIVRELPPEHLYREVRAKLIPEQPFEGPQEEMVRQAVLELSGHLSDEIAGSLVQLAARAQGGALADVVAAALVQDVEKRRELLRELDPGARLDAVMDSIGELIARVGAATSRGPLN